MWSTILDIALVLLGMGTASFYWLSVTSAYQRGQHEMYLKMGGRPDPPDPDDVMRSIQDISTERDILFDKSVVAYVASGVHMFNWKEVYSQIVDGAKEKAKDLSPTVNTLILRQVRIIPGAEGVEVDYNFEPLTNPNKSE